PARAQPEKKGMARVPRDEAHVPAVAVRQHGFARPEPRRDELERLVPADALQLAALAATDHRVKDPVRGADALVVARDLVAEESLGEGVIWIAVDFRDAAVLDGRHDAARVRTIVRTDGLNFFHNLRRPGFRRTVGRRQPRRTWRGPRCAAR